MIWLIGAGPMSIDYLNVLQAQEQEVLVIGRSEKSAITFTQKTGVSVQTGGLRQWLSSNPDLPDAAIVAVGVNQLAPIATLLLDYGVKRILLEKPAGLNSEEIIALNQKNEEAGAEIIIAYNRRFYASTQEGRKIIQEDGGVSSFNFEFTEWSHIIENLKTPAEILQSWFLANSSHVVDLAFYLGGEPENISCYTSGSLKWHPSASAFAGAGVSKAGALFSYQANWAAPGRWGVEVLTKKHRLYFRPMEQLHIQKIGSIAIEKVTIDDSLDTRFKPGLFLQVSTFLEEERSIEMLSIKEHCASLQSYDKMINPG